MARFCRWSPVRIPVGHGFVVFQADHRFESRSCKKIFQVVMGSNPGLGTLLSTFAVVTGSSPGRAKRWSFYRMFHECSTSVPRVFHECSTSVGSTLVEHRGVSWSRGTPVEHPWNIVDPKPPARFGDRPRRTCAGEGVNFSSAAAAGSCLHGSPLLRSTPWRRPRQI